LKHLFENVAARAFEIDEDDVGIDRPDVVEELRRVVDPHHAHVPGRVQTVLDDGRAQRILVDYGNAQIPVQRSSMGSMDALLHVAGQGAIFARGSTRARVALCIFAGKWPPGCGKNDAELMDLGKITPGLSVPSCLALSSRIDLVRRLPL
jgi:hypothetical protein